MKKIIILTLLAGFLFGSVALAQDLGRGDLQTVAGKAKIDTDATLESRVGNIIASILAVLGTIFLILTIYAGVLWMTASGEEAKIEKAKQIIQAAVIGLAIVMSAYTITYFVGNKLGSAVPGAGEYDIICAADANGCVTFGGSATGGECEACTSQGVGGVCCSVPK